MAATIFVEKFIGSVDITFSADMSVVCMRVWFLEILYAHAAEHKLTWSIVISRLGFCDTMILAAVIQSGQYDMQILVSRISLVV